MDFRVVSGVLAVLCVVLAVVIVSASAPAVPVSSANISVYYLYPLRCVDCDLNKLGQCDYCTSYYDERTLGLVSDEVGVPLEFRVSDAVNTPGVFVSYKNKATLGDARTRYNIAGTLCRFAGVNKSCVYYGAQSKRVSECVAGFGLGKGALVYHTGGSGCVKCEKTDKVVSGLESLSYDDNTPYLVKWADRSKASGAKIVSDCFQSYDNPSYAPQLLCAATGRDLTGDFTLGQARDFADKCIEAA